MTTQADATADEIERNALDAVRVVRRLALGLALVFSLVQRNLLASYRISGASMTPAFLDGDRVVVADLPGFFGPPQLGEAVIAHVHGETLIKRVAGLPGETISVGHGLVRLDGTPSPDPIPPCYHDDSELAPLVLGPGQYFLLGDHRRVSVDSREFGPVDGADIIGRVLLRIPLHAPERIAGARSR